MSTVPEKDDSIILNVHLRSKKFEASIEVPLTADKKKMQELTGKWLELMYAALQIGQDKL